MTEVLLSSLLKAMTTWIKSTRSGEEVRDEWVSE
jgi:hypothetical protein